MQGLYCPFQKYFSVYNTGRLPVWGVYDCGNVKRVAAVHAKSDKNSKTYNA